MPHRTLRRLGLLVGLAIFVAPSWAQPARYEPEANTSAVEAHDKGSPVKARPTRRAGLRDFVMDSAGPYPIAMALFTAGIHQATDNPPDWRQGAAGFSERFGSNMGITAVGNAARFSLAEMLDEDTSFHRCRCKGPMRRLSHAALSALTARRRSDGSTVFSIPGLVAPYTATVTAVYGWYPARYGIQDALRMGNYNLLGTVGSNITFEFLPNRVRQLLARVHLNSRRISDEP